MSALLESQDNHGHPRIASSRLADTRAAIDAVLDEIEASAAQFSIVFFSPNHDAAIVSKRLGEAVGLRGVAGSTAGELASGAFYSGSIVGIALHGSVRASVRLVPKFSDFSLVRASGLAAELASELGYKTSELSADRHMWMLVLDGASGREDLFTPFFATHAPRIPLIGGSLGDSGKFERTWLGHEGTSHTGTSAVILLEYDRPFELIHHTHLEFREHWFEVTDTARGGRLLTGLDHRPALQAYSEAIGVAISDLDMEIASSNPFGTRFRGRPFPCSIARVDPDGLLLAYAVQRGDRLALLRPERLVEKTYDVIEATIEKLRQRGADAPTMLAFSCLGRYFEALRLGVTDELAQAMDQLPFIGLNTHGEQFGSRHMNHSLCAVLFG